MAYARYDRECDWYIFWHSRKGDEQTTRSTQELAIWHSDHRAEGPLFTYGEVKDMLSSGDFSRIPGRQPSDDTNLATWLAEFAADVEGEH